MDDTCVCWSHRIFLFLSTKIFFRIKNNIEVWKLGRFQFVKCSLYIMNIRYIKQSTESKLLEKCYTEHLLQNDQTHNSETYFIISVSHICSFDLTRLSLKRTRRERFLVSLSRMVSLENNLATVVSSYSVCYKSTQRKMLPLPPNYLFCKSHSIFQLN